MLFRSRVPDEKQSPAQPPRHADGAALVDGPVRLDWTLAEVTSYRLFFPEPYVPAYAYPLIVYIHDDSRSDADLSRWFPDVSGQNFLAAAVRAPFPDAVGLPGRFSWKGEPLRSARKLVAEAVDHVSSLWKIHPDRLILMGEGLGADLALEMALSRPAYSGAIAISPRSLPDMTSPEKPRAPKRILVACEAGGTAENQVPPSDAGSGHSVAFLELKQGARRRETCRQINHWLMKSIPGTIW
jgi:hypothetical protein